MDINLDIEIWPLPRTNTSHDGGSLLHFHFRLFGFVFLDTPAGPGLFLNLPWSLAQKLQFRIMSIFGSFSFPSLPLVLASPFSEGRGGGGARGAFLKALRKGARGRIKIAQPALSPLTLPHSHWQQRKSAPALERAPNRGNNTTSTQHFSSPSRACKGGLARGSAHR